MTTACFSSFTFGYLDRARVLFRSLRKWQPSWKLIALISDKIPGTFGWDAKSEPFDHVVYITELGINELDSWMFKHDVVELCTAVKGPFICQLFEQGYEKIFYLDPDTCVFNSLNELEDGLEKHDILLTPHQLIPDDDPSSIVDNEITSLATGIYNLGFVAVSNSAEGRRFAKWWADRLLLFCYDDIPRGLFVDQRWCDHVPSFFENVRILKDPGYNVASWNLSKRKVRINTAGTILVNERPLRFWHFTKLGPLGDTMTRKHAGSNYQVYELWRWYRMEIRRSITEHVPPKYWAYGHYSDGALIERPHRLLYRVRRDLQVAFPNPYLSGPGTYQQWISTNSHEFGGIN